MKGEIGKNSKRPASDQQLREYSRFGFIIFMCSAA